MMTQDIEVLATSEANSGSFPGIVLLVQKEQKVPYSLAKGFRQINPTREAMTEDTIFDLASMTKPLATALLTLHIANREKINLDRKIGGFLTDISPKAGEITLRQLLLHTGGLPPVPDIYLEFPDPQNIDYERALKKLLSVVPEKPPGTEVIYSCTGYLILGQFLKRLTGLRLQKLFTEIITGPCGIDDLFFNPEARFRSRTATTEFCSWRKRWIRGEVHDENSYSLGGDGGNAGLFGTAYSVLALLSLFDSEGTLNGVQVLPPSCCALMRNCLTGDLNSRRAIGFIMQNKETLVGPMFSQSSFGHTGFTGTSVWIEPEKKLKIVTLTNRVHLGREATDQKIKDFRIKIHSAVYRIWA